MQWCLLDIDLSISEATEIQFTDLFIEQCLLLVDILIPSMGPFFVVIYHIFEEMKLFP